MAQYLLFPRVMTVDIGKYDEVLQRLFQEAVACAPPKWNQGRLTIRFDGSALHYHLEGDPDQPPAVATPQLARLCGELYVRMETDGQQWSGCLIGFTKTPDESWNFEVRFTYPP